MIRQVHIWFVLMAISAVFIGCKADGQNVPIDSVAPRLIVSGTVTNTSGEALSGIRVSLNGFITADGREIAYYNYAVTDAAGQYTIIRYRGRDTIEEIEVSATDSTGTYQQQTLLVPVRYEQQRPLNHSQPVPFDGFATANFILCPKE